MSTSEESASIQPKQSEPVAASTEEPAPPVAEPVEATPDADSGPTSSKKRKKAAPQLDEQGNPIKKVRAPFVYTDKRKQAFELCRLKRAETLAKKREAESELKEKQKEVRSTMREIRGMMYKDTDPELIKSYLSNTLHSVQMASQTSKMNEPASMQAEPTPVSAAAAPSTVEPDPVTRPMPQVESRPAPTKRSYEEEEAPAQRVGGMHVEERPVAGWSAPTPRMGTGAGNHEPYEVEPGYGVAEADDGEDENMVAGSEPTDEEVAAMYEQARMEAERRGIFNRRRETGKMVRPSNASMFLDHAYVHNMGAHPSQLRGRTQAPPSAGAGEASNIVWL